MKPEDYVNSVVGKPWVKGSDDPAVGLDCWGLVLDSFRRIDGRELPPVFQRQNCDLHRSAAIALRRGDFVPCDEKEGALWTLVDSSGCLVHVGRILCGRAVHAAGSEIGSGSVVAWPLVQTFQHYRSRGFTVEFYEVAGG